jgi:hypothetical protein
VSDRHTTFGEEAFNVARAQAKDVIQPHCVIEDLARKPMTAI